MTFFLFIFSVIEFFLGFQPLSIIPISHISCCLNTLYPYIDTEMLFSRFYILLSTLVTVNTPFISSYFITAQTAFHHCTFCASLHVRTSPGLQENLLLL